MKTLKIEAITLPRKSVYQDLNKYSIFVNWGTTCLFSSKKDAENYQNALNNWLNDLIFKINEAFLGVLTAYRRLWVFYDMYDKDEQTILKELNFLEISLNNCIIYNTPGSGFSNVLRNTYNSLVTIINIYNLLETKQRGRNNWEAIKFIQFEKQNISQLINEVENYPRKKFLELFKDSKSAKVTS